VDLDAKGPIRGVANNSAFYATPEDLAPLSAMGNVRLFGPVSDRPRFGQREGTVLLFNQVLGDGNPIQALSVIQRASGTASYARTGDDPLAITQTDALDTYRYSRRADRYKRNGASNGRPRVCFVADPNLSINRAFGLLSDNAVLASRGLPLVSPDTPETTVTDILRVSGRCGTGAGQYDEQTGANHQVIMGMHCCWHPKAGVSGDPNEHTLVFASLIAPGANTTFPAGYNNGVMYISLTAVNVDTGDVLWRNVAKDADPNAAENTAIQAATGSFVDDPGGGNMLDPPSANAPINIISNDLVVDTDYTYLAASWFIYVFNTATGAYLQRITVGRWSQEIQKIIIRNGLPRRYKSFPSGFDETLSPKSLVVVFKGTNGNNGAFVDSTTGKGPLPVDDARFIQALADWRSGVAEYRIFRNSDGTAKTAIGTIIEQLEFPEPTDGVTKTEVVAETAGGTPHYTLRFSSILDRNPRGCTPYAACRGVDPLPAYTSPGSAELASAPIFVGITNRGYGVSSATPTALTNANLGTAAGWAWPDSSCPPTSLVKLDGKGNKIWEKDTQSLLSLYNPVQTTQPALAWYNDIPTKTGAGGPEATIMGMVCDAAGDVYIAGKRNNYGSQPTSGVNVAKVNGETGQIVWQQNLSGIVWQHCIAISPLDGSVLVCGMRNDSWDDDGSGGTYKFLWRLSQSDGEVLDSLDLGLDETLWGTGVDAANNNWKSWDSGFSISVDQIGRVAFCTTPGV